MPLTLYCRVRAKSSGASARLKFENDEQLLAAIRERGSDSDVKR
jgi:hypothetical protein